MAYQWKVCLPNKFVYTFISLAIGVFCLVADQQGISMALPTISEYFSSDLPTTQWVLVSYVLAISVALLPMGRVSDLIGHKRIYVLGFGICSITTLVAGFSPSILALIIACFIRGIGSGMTQSTSMALMVSLFGRERTGQALGIYISVVGVGSAAGPLISGYLLSTYDWRILFFLLSVLGLIATSTAAVLVPGDKSKRFNLSNFHFDWIGALLFTVSLNSFLQAMTWSPDLGYLDWRMIVLFLTSIFSVIGFVFRELTTSEPMMDLRFFKRRLFSSGVASAFLFFIGISCNYLFIPFYLQIVLGYEPYQIGFFTASSALSMAVVGSISGRFSDRFNPNWFTGSGLLISCLGMLILATLDMDSSWVAVVIGLILISFGLGTFYGANNKIILSAIPRNSHGVVSGFIHLVRNSASVISMGVGVVVVTSFMSSMGFAPTLAGLSVETEIAVLEAFVKGMRFVFLSFSFILMLGFFITWLGGKYMDEFR